MYLHNSMLATMLKINFMGILAKIILELRNLHKIEKREKIKSLGTEVKTFFKGNNCSDSHLETICFQDKIFQIQILHEIVRDQFSGKVLHNEKTIYANVLVKNNNNKFPLML